MLALVFVAHALAQDNDRSEEGIEPLVKVKQVTLLDFEGAHVSADVEGPGMVLAMEPGRREHLSLIRLRANFDEEMAGSVNEAR